jgi:hypothetical protein
VALYRTAVVYQGIVSPYERLTWRNVYTIEADSYSSALAAGDVLAGLVAVFHTDKTRAVRVTAHLVTEPPRRTGAQMGIARTGEYSPVGDPWPMFNCIRCDFPDDGLGRPERKYFRVGLHDGMVQADGTLLGTFASIVQAQLNTMTSLSNYVGPSGEQHTTDAASVNPVVQMRQLSWHRRQRAGFRRGYVAV